MPAEDRTPHPSAFHHERDEVRIRPPARDGCPPLRVPAAARTAGRLLPWWAVEGTGLTLPGLPARDGPPLPPKDGIPPARERTEREPPQCRCVTFAPASPARACAWACASYGRERRASTADHLGEDRAHLRIFPDQLGAQLGRAWAAASPGSAARVAGVEQHRLAPRDQRLEVLGLRGPASSASQPRGRRRGRRRS